MKAEGAGIKPLGYAATYELTRDFMPQAYGSDPQGIDGGAFIEFRDAPTGNDTNGVPKYRVIPEWLAGTVHRDYVNMWFDNKEYSREHFGNVLYLQSGNYAGALDGFGGLINGWNLWPIGASIVFCKNGITSDVLKKKTVVHEIGHRFGLRKAVGYAYLYIDTDYLSKRAHDDSAFCVMNYKSIEPAHLEEPTEFSVEGLIGGSGNPASPDDSLRSGVDR